MPEDMRQQTRYTVSSTVFIELAAPEFGSKDPGKIARCKTVDISRLGLRINLDQELAVNAILQLAVELPARAGTLFLAGEVRWCRPIPGTNRQPEWSAGLNLLNADASDIDSWGVLLDAMES